MGSKLNIELDEQFLTKFFALTDRVIPDGQEVTLLMLKRQLDEIEDTLIESRNASDIFGVSSNQPADVPASRANKTGDSFSSFDEVCTFNLPKKTILIIDDLGVITYQLSVLFKNLGYETIESKEIYDAIEKFKKQKVDLVLMDLFIPTEREGFILLEELKKTAQNKPTPVKIGIMSASSKKEHKQMCKIKGAEFYVEKVDDWQKELLAVAVKKI